MRYRGKWQIEVDAENVEDARDLAREAMDEARFTVEPVEECKGKAAARALAVMVLDPKVYAWLFDHDRKALQQAENALVPFGYPDLDVLRAKLITQK